MHHDEITTKSLVLYPGVKLYVAFHELGTYEQDSMECPGGFHGDYDVASATLEAFGVVLNLLEGFPSTINREARFGEVLEWMGKKWPRHLMDSISDCYETGSEVMERKAA